MSVDAVALRTELQSDPSALGYAAAVASGNDQSLADALNLPRSGAAFSQFRNAIPAADVVGAVAPADFTALNQLLTTKLQFLFTGGFLDATNSNTRAIFLALFAGATAPTVTALTALASRQGSRAEKLFGAGVAVTTTDVSRALRGAG